MDMQDTVVLSPQLILYLRNTSADVCSRFGMEGCEDVVMDGLVKILCAHASESEVLADE